MLLVVSVALVSFAAGWWLGRRGADRQAEPKPAAVAARPAVEPEPQPPEFEIPPTETPPALPPAERRAIPPLIGEAKVALVIDDLGRRVADVTELEALGVPLSYGVLPFESRTSQVIAELRRHDAEFLVHLPMEARNGANPGPGALARTMTRAELAQATRWALDAVTGAAGVNNHMGSAVMSDRETLAPVLEILAERGLFFLDSRTAPDTVGYRSALELGIPAAERQVFLDPEAGEETVREQFHRLLGLAGKNGAAIAIGHPHAATIAVLSEEVPRALRAGYEFVPVSYLLDRRQAGLE